MSTLVEADRNDRNLRIALSGYQEVPSVSTPGSGEFVAKIAKDDDAIDDELSYSGPSERFSSRTFTSRSRASTAASLSGYARPRPRLRRQPSRQSRRCARRRGP